MITSGFISNLLSLKSIDKIVGRFICRLLPRPQFFEHDKITRVMVIRPGGIGDAILLSQTIISLKKFYPNGQIYILAEKRNKDAFQLVPVFRVLCYDRQDEFIQVFQSQYDVVIDTEQWHRLSAVVAWLVRAPFKIGFDTNERRQMFTHAIPYDLKAYEAGNFLALLKPLGGDCNRDSGAVTLELPPESASKAGQLLKPLCSESFVVIFSGSSVPEKHWGAERYAQVAKRLVSDGYKVVAVGGHEERVDGDEIVGDEGLNLAGKTTLPETAAVIARSRLVICGDSGVLHIAAGLGVPTVSLFGPSSDMKWAPRGEKHAVLSHHLPCSPCSKFGTIPPCPINVRCMKEITPEAVLEAAKRLLSQPPVQSHQ